MTRTSQLLVWSFKTPANSVKTRLHLALSSLLDLSNSGSCVDIAVSCLVDHVRSNSFSPEVLRTALLRCLHFSACKIWQRAHGQGFCTQLALRHPQTFEKLSEFLSEQCSQRWISNPQFWYPPLRSGSQHRILSLCFF